MVDLARNCRMAVVIALVASLACGGDSAVDETSPRAVAGCGLEFELPQGWEVAPLAPDSAARCAITLDLADHAIRDSSNLEGDYQVRVETSLAQFDSLMHLAGFAKRDSGWVVLGRHAMESPALPVTRSGWRGVHGIASAGCWSKGEGTYAGLCDMPRAALLNGELGVVIEAGPGAEGAFNRVLATIQLRSGK